MLGLMNNFVKAMKKEGGGIQYLKKILNNYYKNRVSLKDLKNGKFVLIHPILL